MFDFLFQLANQTVLEEEGLFFLDPIYRLFFESYPYSLSLPRSCVSVCYKTYHNTYKHGIQIGPNDLSLRDAVDQELTPGKKLNTQKF